MNNVLKHDKNTFIIDEDINEGGLIVKSKKEDTIITLYDEKLIKNTIDIKFNKKYKKLLSLSISIINDEEDDNNSASIALLEIDKFKKYIINNYGKHISEKTLNKYLKMLDVLNSELENKLKERTMYTGKSR